MRIFKQHNLSFQTRIFLAGLSFCLFLLSTTATFARQKPSDLSTDEAFDYILKNLHDRMQEFRDNNNRLSNQNKALNKRIIFLREQIRNLEQQKIDFLEESMELIQVIKLESQEMILPKRKEQNLYERKDQLLMERGLLQRRMKNVQARQEALKENVVRLEGKVKVSEKHLQHKEEVSEKRQKEGEEYKYKQLLEKTRERREHWQNERTALGKSLIAPKQSKDDSLEMNDLLKERLKQDQADLKEEIEKAKSLGAVSQKISKEKEETKDLANKEIARIKLYIKGLEISIKELNEIKSMIASGDGQYQEEMDGFMKSLQEERRLLSEKENVRSRSASIKSELKRKVAANASKGELTEKLKEENNRLKTKQEVLQAELTGIKKQQKSYHDKEEQLTQNIQQMKKQFISAQQQTASRGKQNKTEIKNFRQLLKETQKRMERVRKERLAWNKKFVEPAKRKKESLEKQGNLKERLLQVRADLEVEVDKEQSLQTLRQDKKEQIIKQANVEVAHLRIQIEGLEETVKEFSGTKTKVESQYGQYRQEMDELKRILEEERRLLLEKENVSKRSIALNDELRGEIQAGASNQSISESLEERNNRLKTDQIRIQAKIADLQKQELSYRNKEEEINRDIQQMKVRMDSAQRQKVSAGQNALKERKERLSKLVKDQARKNQSAQQDIDALRNQAKKSKSGLALLKEEEDNLRQSLTSVNKDLQSLGDIEESLKQKRQNLVLDEGQATRRVKEDIEALILHSQKLSSSLSLIQAKYNVKEMSGNEMADEDPQLYEYLSILKEEHASLKDKMATLLSAIEILEVKKQSLIK